LIFIFRTLDLEYGYILLQKIASFEERTSRIMGIKKPLLPLIFPVPNAKIRSYNGICAV